MTGEGASNANYQWQPPATASSSYAAANALNQYPSVTSGTTYPLTYDAKGNLSSGNIALTGSSAWGFTYDPENRLTNACKPYVSGSCSSPTVNATYAYDPLGRRTHKSGTGTTETFFLNDDAGNEIAEYDSTGALTRRFVPGPGINDPVAMVTGTGTYTHTFYHTDHHGSVAVTARDNGNPMNGPFLYDPHGNCTISSSGAACTTLAATVQPFFFTGMYLDKETGLFFDRARFYSSILGRFLQTDPVGYDVDLNLYTYAGNDPINSSDPTGLIDAPNTCSRLGGAGCSGSYTGNGTGSSDPRRQSGTNSPGSEAAGITVTSATSPTGSSPADTNETCPNCLQYAGNTPGPTFGGGITVHDPGGQPYVPDNALPSNSRQVLQGRQLNPDGSVTVFVPKSYVPTVARNNQGIVFLPPGQSLGDNRNIIRWGDPNMYNPYNYLRVYNGGGQPISVYSGKPLSNNETHFEISHIHVEPGH